MKIKINATFRRASEFTAMIAFAIISLGYILLCWTNDVYDIRGDGSGYMLGAAYYSPFQVGTPVLTEYAKLIVYPPLFPALIGLVGGSGHAAHLIVAASLLLSIVLIYMWLKTEGWSVAESAAAALLFALLPASYLQALNIWTENTFLMFNFAAVYFVARAESPVNERQHFWWLAALAVAAATLTRVAALPLLVAFIFFLTIRRPRKFISLGMLATLPFVAWVIWSKLTQTGLAAYTSHWSTSYGQDFAAQLILQLRSEIGALINAWQIGFVGEGASPLLYLVASLFGLIGLVGWLVRLIALKFDAIYFALYAFLLLTWPHPEEALRYGYVLFPFLIAYAIFMVSRLEVMSWNQDWNAPVTAVVCISMAMIILPGLFLNIKRFLQEVPADVHGSNRIDEWYTDNKDAATRMSQFHHRLNEHLNQVQHFVATDACIFSIKPTVITLRTLRMSYSPPATSADKQTFDRQISRCRYVYGLALVSPSFNQPLYPINQLGARAKILSVKRMANAGKPMIVGVLAEILPASN